MPATDWSHYRWSDRDPGYTQRKLSRVNVSETEIFDALEDTFYGPDRKKGERLHDHALRVQSNVRELARQGVRLPDQVQGFLVLRRAGNSLSFSDARKACKRYADELVRDPKEYETRGPHTVFVSQAKEASVAAEEQERDSDVDPALRPWPVKATSIWKRSRDTAGLQRVTKVT